MGVCNFVKFYRLKNGLVKIQRTSSLYRYHNIYVYILLYLYLLYRIIQIATLNHDNIIDRYKISNIQNVQDQFSIINSVFGFYRNYC